MSTSVTQGVRQDASYLIVAIALLLFEIPPSFAQTPKGSPAQQKSVPPSPTGQPAQKAMQPAQAPAAAAQPSNEPQATTASFADWMLRCQRTGTGAEAHQNCELAQSVMVKGQQAPVAQLAFGKMAPTSTEPLHVTVAVPHNISFPSTVRVAID